MPEPLEYSFDGQKEVSDQCDAEIRRILLEIIPGAMQAVRACAANDKRGTDWWVEMRGGYWISVDVKFRDEDFSVKPPEIAGDDLALETWSVVERGIIGWTRDPNKRTDYILWYWRDTKRCCLVPFPMLCRVFCNNWEAWRTVHKFVQQHTTDKGDYHSECIFVPRREVWAAIYTTFSGQTK
jgi:hypothetical protein